MKYFTKKELQCPHTKEMILAEGFGDAIDGLREACGFALVVNSCCRSAEYNAALPGHPKSLHVYDHPHHPTGGCCAVDFAMTDGRKRIILIRKAEELGFSIGIAKSFIHCDIRTTILGMDQTSWVY